MAATNSELDKKDQSIIEFLQNNGGFAGTAEVATEIDLTTNGAEYRLKELEKDEKIASRVVSRDKVWYLPSNDPTTYQSGIWMAVIFGGFILAVVTTILVGGFPITTSGVILGVGIGAAVGVFLKVALDDHQLLPQNRITETK